MKRKREMTQLRDAELLRDYRQHLNAAMKRGGEINRMDVIRETLCQSTPRYYLNFDQAYSVMSQIKRHGSPMRKLTLKRQMWLEIYGKVQAEIQANHRLTVTQALARVLISGHASRYFISEQYAYRYLYTVQHEKRPICAPRRA